MSDINYQLFPTLIIQKKDFLSKEQAINIFDYLLSKKEIQQPHNAIANGVSSFLSGDCILQNISKEIDSCNNLYSDVMFAVRNYGQQTGIQSKNAMGTVIDNSWFNIQNTNGMLAKHTHPMSIISGGLYINIDKNSSPLCFFNPVNLLECMPSQGFTEYNCQFYKIMPEIGDLILFPSFLAHGSGNDMNQTDNRTVISFNTH
jgi:hypothetical protein